MYPAAEHKKLEIERLLSRNFVFSTLTHSALMRHTLDMEGRTATLPEVVNGQEIPRELAFDYKNPEELALFDRLILPKITAVFTSAAKLEVSTLIRQPWTPQSLFAVNNGGVSPRTFAEITDLLAAHGARVEGLRQEGVLMLPRAEARYA